MSTYKVLVVGMGKRGMHHASAFRNNPRFELAAICEPVAARLETATAEFKDVTASSDPLAIAKDVRPDIFCFCTPPNVRLNLINIGIESGSKLIAYEKP